MKERSEPVGVDREVATASPPLINSKNHRPGRELDALIAEKVFGAQVSWFSLYERDGGPDEDWLPGKDGAMPNREMLLPDTREWINIPNYSTEIAAAWEVVKCLRKRGFHPRIESRQANEWWSVDFATTEFQSVLTNYALQKTADHAICLAALRAVDA